MANSFRACAGACDGRFVVVADAEKIPAGIAVSEAGFVVWVLSAIIACRSSCQQR